jgi:hypothetical protein
MFPPSLCCWRRNPLEAESALATLYNNLLPAGNGFLFFFLIVCTFAFLGAWKTGLILWIPGKFEAAGK